MVSTRLYTAIFALLFVLASAQAAIEYAGLLDRMYWIAFGAILVLSFVKAAYVAGYYQHLRYEPRSVAYVIATGLLAAVALTVAAAYSIT